MKKSQTFVRRTMLLSFSFLLLAVSFLTIRAAGEVDPAFKAALQDTTFNSVQTISILPSGKIFIGGNFTVAGKTGRSNIARLNADGTVDETFNPPDFYGLSNGIYTLRSSQINALAVQADGKVIVGGIFDRIGSVPKRNLARLNADGSFDSTFNTTFRAENPAVINDIKISNDGKILIAGNFVFPGPTPNLTLARLNSDGSVDASFNANVSNATANTIAVQPDGKILIGATNTVLRRINSDGTVNASFGQVNISGQVLRIVLQPDGKILVGGSFSNVNGFTQNNLTRLDSVGNIDTGFNVNGAGASQSVSGIAVLPDGKIFIGGMFNTYNGTGRQKAARLNSDGTLDAASVYTPGASATINDAKSTGDGSVIIGGGDTAAGWDKLTRINADGSLDATFAGAVYLKGYPLDVVEQPDGKILLAGVFRKVNGVVRQTFVRLNADGSVDNDFAVTTTPYAGGTSIALQPDGKILIAGLFTSVNGGPRNFLARLNSNGSVDTTFTFSGFTNYIDEIIVQPDGKILLGGSFSNSTSPPCVLRLNSDGSIDASFSQPTALAGSFNFNVLRTMKLQSDGKIIIGGQFTQINGTPRGRIARLNQNGTLDTAFNPPFGANSDVVDLAVQSNGSIVIGGYFTGVNGANNKFYLARLLPDGTLDNVFTSSINLPVFAIEAQSDDKLLIGGDFTAVDGTPRLRLARLQSNGTLDNSFTGSGANDAVRFIYSQRNGNILVGGEFSRINDSSNVGIARLLNTTAPRRTPFDFDGDGRADVSVFRPSTGYWFTSPNPATNYGAFQFGQNGDKLVPADYDGDGKTDVAVVRNGNWYIQRSSSGFSGTLFGDPNDIPVPADYDGDGRADIAVFRPSNGTWYLLQSQAGYTAVPLGLGTDKPVPGDYNGDGRAEVAVFRPSNGYWYLSTNPANNYGGIPFGQAEDKPVPADYDGDGRTDIAVFRPSNGGWYLLQSTAGFTGTAFGFGTDSPTPADYDGDGRADIAVFRSGNWYLNRSTQGFTAIQFGVSTDLPVPNAFVR